MGETCWRNIESFPALPIQSLNEGVYTSSTLNWFTLPNFTLGYEWDAVNIDRLVIVSIDLGKQSYRQLLLAHVVDGAPPSPLGVLMDSLCLSHD